MGLGLEACSTDDLGSVTARGPDDLAIEKVETTGSAVTESGGTLELGCSAPILVWIGPYARNDNKLGDFTLAPPGDCGTLTNCGWIVLEAQVTRQDGTVIPPKPLVTQAIQSPIELNLPAEMLTLPAEMLALPAEMRTAGTLTLRVGLRDVWGDPVLKGDGQPLSKKFSVELKPEGCP
jgi:hypothetical protein